MHVKVPDTECAPDIYLLSFTSEESEIIEMENYKGPFQDKRWCEVL